MVELQIESVEAPLLGSPAAATLALGLVTRAHLMGFLPAQRENGLVLDGELLAELAAELRKQGIATTASSRLARATQADPLDDRDLVAVLRATVEAVDSSPHPEGEWPPARELLGDDLLARLLRVSISSLRRYASGERRTPDDAAWRLHVVARVLAALTGSYNDYGIRRWFERPRSPLGDATPARVLEEAESEDDEQLQRVLALADELMGAAAAA
jgi:hypothetical protein